MDGEYGLASWVRYPRPSVFLWDGSEYCGVLGRPLASLLFVFQQGSIVRSRRSVEYDAGCLFISRLCTVPFSWRVDKWQRNRYYCGNIDNDGCHCLSNWLQIEAWSYDGYSERLVGEKVKIIVWPGRSRIDKQGRDSRRYQTAEWQFQLRSFIFDASREL